MRNRTGRHRVRRCYIGPHWYSSYAAAHAAARRDAATRARVKWVAAIAAWLLGRCAECGELSVEIENTFLPAREAKKRVRTHLPHEAPASQIAARRRAITEDGNMKKRLRKKLHRGEFNHLGFSVTVKFSLPLTEKRRDEVMDQFSLFLESVDLYCGGAFGVDTWDFEVGRGHYGQRIRAGYFKYHHDHCTQDDRDAVGEYMRACTPADEYVIGPLKGSW